MAWSPVVRRIAGGFYLTLVAGTIAHATNAFFEDALSEPFTSHAAPISDLLPLDFPEPAALQQRAEDVLQSKLFELPTESRSTKDGGPVASGPPPQPIDAARKIALLGSVLANTGGVMAVIEDLTSRHQDLYRLGAEVPNVGTLAAIEKDRVLFRNGPSEEWLALLALTQLPKDGFGYTQTPSPTPQPTTPTRRVLDRREVNAALNDQTRLMMQAQAVPYLTDGKLDGFRLDNVMPSGFFDKVGLRTNDVVQRINGVELRDPGMLLSLLQQLRNERTVRIDIARNSQRQTLSYDIR